MSSPDIDRLNRAADTNRRTDELREEVARRSTRLRRPAAALDRWMLRLADYFASVSRTSP